jgi:hypothetical protein
MSTPPNPLLGWAGASQAGLNLPGQSPLPTQSPVQTPSTPFNPGNLANPQTNIKDIQRNAGNLNNQQGQMFNSMIPGWANMMQSAGGNAGNFFNTLMNLGSPYYQQQQAANFTQGVQQGNNASALARQQQAAQGTGYTPSGANAAMIGGMGQAQAQNLNLSFLQNLFNNEQMQLAGASGLGNIAQMFNPTQLRGTVANPGSTQGPDYGLAAMNDLFSGAKSASTGGG